MWLSLYGLILAWHSGALLVFLDSVARYHSIPNKQIDTIVNVLKTAHVNHLFNDTVYIRIYPEYPAGRGYLGLLPCEYEGDDVMHMGLRRLVT